MKALMKTTVVAVAALWAGALLAQSPPAGPPNPAAHLEKLALLLDLTDAQKPQVQSILEAQHAQMKALMEQAKAAGGKPDFQAMQAAHQQIMQDTLAKLSGVLTPVQLKKFQALHEMHPRGGAAAVVPPPQSN